MTDLHDVPKPDGTIKTYKAIAEGMGEAAMEAESPLDNWLRTGAEVILALVGRLPQAYYAPGERESPPEVPASE